MSYARLAKRIWSNMERSKALFRSMIPAIAAVLSVVAIVGCRESCGDTLRPYGWKRVGEPFDSVTAVLERRFLRYRDFDSARNDIELLDRLAADDTGRSKGIKQARALYWKGRMAGREGDRQLAVRLLDSAAAMIDSTAYPYDLRRIRWTIGDRGLAAGVATSGWYDQIIDDINFYESVGDYVLAGDRYLELATTLCNLGYDRNETLAMIDMADSLFTLAGMNRHVVNNGVNRAYVESFTDKKRATEILRNMLRDSVVNSQPQMLYLIYNNLYKYDTDTAALRLGYEYVSSYNNNSDLECYYESMLAQNAMLDGDFAKARKYCERSLDKIDYLTGLSTQVVVCRALADVETSLGNIEIANKLRSNALVLMDSIEKNTARNHIMQTELDKHIARMKRSVERASYRRYISLLIVIFALVVIIGLIGWVAYRRVQRQKLIGLAEKLKLEQSERKVLAMKLAMEEKDNMMSSIENEIDKLVDMGEMTQISTRKLKNAIKLHFAEEDGRDNFIETFTKVNPSFNDRLRGEFQSLSDADLKLAAMISIGLDNKQIARILSIRPESVKQARWRLRSKLNLQSADNLAAFLGRYIR